MLQFDELVRAYPVQVMIWHEIVNDPTGEIPVTVTYCPLCNSGIAFDRRVDGRVLDFGTSGALYQSALVTPTSAMTGPMVHSRDSSPEMQTTDCSP